MKTKVQIEDILDRIGFDKRSIGFWYIVEYINLLDKPEWKDAKPIAIYHKVANTGDVATESVMGTISRQILNMRKRRPDSCKYLGDENAKPTEALMRLHDILEEEREKPAGEIIEEDVRKIVREEIMYAMRLVFPERMRDYNGLWY